MSEKWILSSLADSMTIGNDGYYTGKSYIYQGAKYAVVDKDIAKAKTYSTYLKAVAACNKFRFENYNFKVVRQSENETDN